MSHRRRTQEANRAAGLICVVDGCERGVFEGARCGYHEQIEVWARRAARGHVCRVDGCDRGVHARGLCRGHYTTEYNRERRARAAAAREGVVPDAGDGLP